MAPSLREVNRIMENSARGGYRVEFCPTGGDRAVGLASHRKAR
jgi:hypothetical protein